MVFQEWFLGVWNIRWQEPEGMEGLFQVQNGDRIHEVSCDVE